jgi:hypothetical protein
MQNPFRNFVAEYQALPSLDLSGNLEKSPRFILFEKVINSSVDIEHKADIITYFLDEFRGNWKDKYEQKIYYLIEEAEISIYAKSSFLAFLSINKSKKFPCIFENQYILLCDELISSNFANWFLVLNYIDYIDVYDDDDMRTMYYEKMLEILISLEDRLPQKEFQNTILNNQHCLNFLRKFLEGKTKSKVPEKWL